MSEEKPLINRVAQSGLLTINLEDYLPDEQPVVFDLKEFLYMELILKEKEFRQALKEHDWSVYAGKAVLVTCSADAIIPLWAYMLVAAYAAPYVKELIQGSEEDYTQQMLARNLESLDPKAFAGQRVVIKGCSDRPVPPSAYMHITRLLQPYAQTIMFGEPCSTVPIYKRPRTEAPEAS